jgi:hypothetical protein
MAVILLENSCACSIPQPYRSRVEPFSDHLRATATSGRNSSVICVRNEHIAGLGNVARSRQDGHLSREASSGATIASEYDDVASVIRRGEILENGVSARGLEARVETDNESEGGKSQRIFSDAKPG